MEGHKPALIIGSLRKWYIGEIGLKNKVNYMCVKDMCVKDMCVKDMCVKKHKAQLQIEKRGELLLKRSHFHNGYSNNSNQLQGIPRVYVCNALSVLTGR
jgi:hypothetical protein